MDKVEFGMRLAKIRTIKKISAREMSISIGQNHGYINSIETGRAYPSMEMFFVICDFLQIKPEDFFNVEIEHPHEYDILETYCKKLDEY